VAHIEWNHRPTSTGIRNNHKAIKEFFPKSQLFGFTGTPIFEKNAIYQQIEGQQARACY
jgi:type I site-specific restriction-modification system R (restriction) subunit